ncbi:EF hand domain-containing protein [Caballeronia fortuita]|uniref:EF hand domain-containing protein n=1 Tax=Caballeronia fortuita TaxID=1777138 RepID=A0A158B0X2_9BURK|nr:hypothetical protein [Caballeronia fortuita]SAK63560.1 EF hand domain-containing protein [Caballeronia fortuita]
MTVSNKDKKHSASKPPVPVPAEPPRPKPLNWSYPFAPSNGNASDPQTFLSALGRSQSGYYPLGANGLWHGGIHFDTATGGALKQGDGVRAIADGEVIAYRLDTTYPELKYSDRRMALFSTGFVLLRHKLVLPPDAKQSNVPAKPHGASTSASVASPASAPVASTPSYTPPAEDVLEFYSLYMHQLDWASYQSAQSDKSAQGAGQGATSSQPASSVRRMSYWKGDRRFVVGAKANATQRTPAPSGIAYRFDQLSGQEDQQIQTAADTMPSDGLGNIVEMEAIPDTASARYSAARLRVSAPPVDPAEVNAQKPAQGAQVRDRADGEVIGLLPRGGEVAVIGDATTGWAQLAKIVSGSLVPVKVGDQLDPRVEIGWVSLDELDALIDPNPLDRVVVLDKPFAVQAGDVIGYLGEYQNCSDAQILPPKPNRPILHVEVFAGDTFKAFVERSRERAKALPGTQRSLMLIHQGVKLVTPADADLNVPAGQLLKLAKGDPGKGKWARVQPMRMPSVPDRKGHHKSSGTAAGPEMWVEREASGKTADAPIKGWSKFPLQLANARPPEAAFEQVIARATLEQLDGMAQDDANVRWWNVSVGDSSGRSAWGWVCEAGHPGTEWQSPWSWPGFELVDSSSIPPVNMFKRFLFVTEQLLDGEAEEFSAAAASVNAGMLIGRLEKAVDCQGDGNGKVTGNELRKALGQRWLASALSHIAVRYESEWGGSLSKCDALSSYMGTGRYIWQGELERIQKLQWWDKVKSVKGFPAEPIVWHLHPIGVVANFMQGAASPADVFEFPTSEGIFRVSKKSFDFILSKEGYKDHPYVPGGDQSSGVTIGYGYDLGQQTTERIEIDLDGIFPPTEISRLQAVSGRHGDGARHLVTSLVDIKITKDMALALAVVMKKRYAQYTVDAFPGVTSLHPHCQGALLSLVINRGSGMEDRPHQKTRKHMRAIRDDVAAKNLSDVPVQLRSMRSLWEGSGQGGLLERRAQEAALFEEGIR